MRIWKAAGWLDSIWNNVRLWPWCSWRWCSDLVPPLPLGSSGSPGSQGLNGKQQTTIIIKSDNGVCCVSAEHRRTVTDWVGWFCICLWSCVLGHRALQGSRGSEGSSVEETGTGWTLKQTHLISQRAQKLPWLCFCVNNWADAAVTWYSTVSVLVSVAACCSSVCVSGREELWSSWSHTSFGVETGQTGSTPRLLTSNSRDRLEPRLQKERNQETTWRLFRWGHFEKWGHF